MSTDSPPVPRRTDGTSFQPTALTLALEEQYNNVHESYQCFDLFDRSRYEVEEVHRCLGSGTSLAKFAETRRFKRHFTSVNFNPMLFRYSTRVV